MLTFSPTCKFQLGTIGIHNCYIVYTDQPNRTLIDTIRRLFFWKGPNDRTYNDTPCFGLLIAASFAATYFWKYTHQGNHTSQEYYHVSGCLPLGEAFTFSVGPPHIPVFLPIGLDYAPLFTYFPKSFWPPRINPSLYQFIQIHTHIEKAPPSILVPLLTTLGSMAMAGSRAARITRAVSMNHVYSNLSLE